MGVVLLILSSNLLAQEINVKTNVASLLIGVPSLSLECKLSGRNSLSLVAYGGHFEFLGTHYVRGCHVLYRRYIGNGDNANHLRGRHLDLGLNYQEDWLKHENLTNNKLFAVTTIAGYQHKIGSSPFFYDVGAGGSWVISKENYYYNYSVFQVRLNFSIGFTIIGAKKIRRQTDTADRKANPDLN